MRLVAFIVLVFISFGLGAQDNVVLVLKREKDRAIAKEYDIDE